MFPERKYGAKAFFFLKNYESCILGVIFSKQQGLPGQSRINIILLGAKKIFVELMNMYTKCSLKGNLFCFWRLHTGSPCSEHGPYMGFIWHA